MPGETKQIKFEIIGDAQQLNKVLEAAVRNMQNFAKQISQATGGLIGGATNQGGPIIPGARAQAGTGASAAQTILARSVEDNKRLMDSLKGASNETLKNMADVATRELQREREAIRALNTELDSLNAKYAEHKRNVGAFGPGTAKFETEEMDTLGKKIAENRAAAKNREEGVAALQQVVDGANPPSGPPGNRWSWTRDLFGNMGPNSAVRMGLRAGGLAVGGMTAIANEYTAENFDYVSREARQANAFKTMGLSTSQGDLRFLLAIEKISQDRDKRSEVRGIGNSNIAYGIKEGVGGMLSSLLRLDPNFVGEGIRGIGNTDTKQKDELARYIHETISSDPRFFQHAQEFQAMAGTRVAEMRMAGVGSQGLNRLLQPGNDMGFSEGDVMGVFGQIQNTVGRAAAHNLTTRILSASRSGMDRGALANLDAMNAITQGFVQDEGRAALLGTHPGLRIGPRSIQINRDANGLPVFNESQIRMSMTEDQTKDIMVGRQRPFADLASRLASRDDLNLGARNMAAQAASSLAMNATGVHPIDEILNRLLTGVDNTPMGAAIGRQNVQGLAPGDSLMGGQIDPFQTGMNFLFAQKNAGKDASIYAVRALARNMDMATTMGIMGGAIRNDSDLPLSMRAKGVTLGGARGQVNDILNSVLARVVNENGPNNPMTQAADAMRFGEGTPQEKALRFVKSFHGGKDQKDSRRLAEAALASIYEQVPGFNPESAQGFVRDTLLGNGGKLRGGGGKGHENQITDPAATTKEMQELLQQVSVYAKEMRTSFETIGESLEKLRKLAPDAADKVARMLDRMGDLDTNSEQAAAHVTSGFKELADSTSNLKSKFDEISGNSRASDFLNKTNGSFDVTKAGTGGN